MKRGKFDLASFIMLVAMIYATLVVPNGSNPACNELWCIISVKVLFAMMAWMFFETTFFIGGPCQKLIIYMLAGKHGLEEYKKLCANRRE